MGGEGRVGGGKEERSRGGGMLLGSGECEVSGRQA